MTNERTVFLVHALTDLHPGSGDDYTRNVDRVVQRDTHGFPTVRASGVKGALRDHMQERMEPHERFALFGSRSDSDAGNLQRSAFYTDDLSLVALACNYNSASAYVLATCPMLLRRLARYLPATSGNRTIAEKKTLPAHIYLGDINTKVVKSKAAGVYTHEEIEDADITLLKRLWTHLPEAFAKTNYPFVIVPDSVMKYDIIPNSLQVNARNSLDRGVSENLWFEEVVPADSLFITGLAYNSNSQIEVKTGKKTGKEVAPLAINELIGELEKAISSTDDAWTAPVRLGANKTVGQGQTQWVRLTTQTGPKGDSSTATSRSLEREDQLDKQQIDGDENPMESKLENERVNALGALIDKAVGVHWIKYLHFESSEEAEAFAKDPKVPAKSSKDNGPHRVLWIASESLTALNRISSLLRRPLCEILDILHFDSVGDEPARKQVAQLIAHVLETRNAYPTSKKQETKTSKEPTSVFSQLQESINEGLDSHWIQGARLAIDQALEQLKTVAAFAATPKTENANNSQLNHKTQPA